MFPVLSFGSISVPFDHIVFVKTSDKKAAKGAYVPLTTLKRFDFLSSGNACDSTIQFTQRYEVTACRRRGYPTIYRLYCPMIKGAFFIQSNDQELSWSCSLYCLD